MPPSTQGFAALQILNLLEGFDLTRFGEGTADYYHHIVEAVKVAFADRDEWLTEPAFVNIPLERLLSKDYAEARRALISADRALPHGRIEPGIRFDKSFEKRAPDGGKIYLCATDSDGLVVSMIQSIYHDFGAAVMGGDTGVVMQNRGSFFSQPARAGQAHFATRCYRWVAVFLFAFENSRSVAMNRSSIGTIKRLGSMSG